MAIGYQSKTVYSDSQKYVPIAHVDRIRRRVSMKDNEWHETKVRVRYKDTDRMGVVYYGNYLTYFEIGRAEFMRHLGLSYSEVEKTGYILVVTEAYAKYHSNVGYDKLISVFTRIGDLRSVRIRFDYKLCDESGTVLVTGHTVHGCLNSDKKISRLPAGLRDVLIRNFPSKK